MAFWPCVFVCVFFRVSAHRSGCFLCSSSSVKFIVIEDLRVRVIETDCEIQRMSCEQVGVLRLFVRCLSIDKGVSIRDESSARGRGLPCRKDTVPWYPSRPSCHTPASAQFGRAEKTARSDRSECLLPRRRREASEQEMLFRHRCRYACQNSKFPPRKQD